MLNRAAIFLVLFAHLAVNTLWAGGSGLNIIVVVNQHSTNSVELGNDYCELRGVPPQNLLRITNWTGGSINWSPAEFQNQLRNPLLAMVASRGLSNQAQFVILSMDIPYRVTDGSNENSTTSALFYGFKTNTIFPGGPNSCSLPDNTSNSYAYSELPFSQTPPNTAATNSFLAMMLTDTNLAAAERTLRRGVASDGTWPTQAVYLAKTTDTARNVRFVEFDNSVFENQVVGNNAVLRVQTDNTQFTNLFGLQAGLYYETFLTNEFVPGALADTLTSFAGFLFEDSGTQTALPTFLEAGATGSYGTIVEPCNYTQKFPDPIDYFYQFRGFSLAEAYYQSVLNPFEGLFMGEPLAAPYARPGNANWNSLTNGAVLSGLSALTVNFTAATTNLPLAQVDVFVDGTFFKTMTNLPPAASNVLSIVLNGNTIDYTVPTNATLAIVAKGLADALNLQSNVTHVISASAGDRIELQSQSLYVPGSNVTVSVSEAIGQASALTTQVIPARPVFLDSIAKGYQTVTFSNGPIVGDWINATFIKTNGTTVALGITNTVTGATIGTMVQNLINLINANVALQSVDGVSAADFFDGDPYGEPAAQFNVYANTPSWPASQILAFWTTSTNLHVTPVSMNPLADNVSDLRPRNHLYVSSGANSLTANFALDTTQLSDGYHQLTAVAYEGTSVQTQTRVTRNVLIQNTSLTATFTASPAGTNVTLAQPLQFTITPNATNISSIELFSTGGSQGVITNQGAAVFTISPAYLGLGLHPFDAVVTDQNGHRFQTATIWYRVVPVINLTISGRPPVLTWSTTPNYQYDLQFTTNLTAGFQTLTTIVATNAFSQWPISATNAAGFYRVQLDQ